jgi:hypothetical protein
MGASIGYGRTSLVVGLCIAGAGLALAVHSSSGEGVLALAIGLWITVRSSIRLARPGRDDELDYAVELRRAGVRFTVVGAVAAAAVVVGIVGAIPAFPGGHRWPFLILVFPSAVFLYGGVRAVRAARKSSSRPT